MLLYESLCGVAPFSGEAGESTTANDLIRRVRDEEAPRLSSRDPSLRGEIEWVVGKAMAKSPEDRYESAGALARDIECLLESRPVSAGPPSTVYAFAKLERRHRTLAAVAAVALVALAGGTVVSTSLYVRASRLGRNLQSREVELRESFRNADYRLALQMAERRRTGDAIAYLCRALRTDPDHEASASCLLFLLSHHRFTNPVRPPVAYPPGIDGCRSLAVFDANRPVMGIGETGEGVDVLLRFGVDEEVGEVIDQGKEARPLSFLRPLTREGRFALVSGPEIEVRDVTAPGEVRERWSMPAAVSAFVVEARDDVAVAGDRSGTLRAWRPSDGSLLGERRVGDRAITCLTLGRDGEMVGYGMKTGEIGTWRIGTDVAVGPVQRHHAPVTAIDMPRSGVVLAAGDEDGVITVHRAMGLVPAMRPIRDNGAIRALLVHSRIQQLFVGTDRGFPRMLDLSSGNPVAMVGFQQGGTDFADFAFDPDTLVLGGGSGAVRLVAFESGNGESLAGAGQSDVLSSSPSRRWLAAGSGAHRHVAVHDLGRFPSIPRIDEGERETDRGETKEAGRVVASRDGKTRVLQASALQLRIQRQGKTVAVVRRTQPVTACAIGPGGRIVAVLRGQNRVDLWDAVTGEARSPTLILGRPARNLRFSGPESGDRIELDLSDVGRATLPIPPAGVRLPEWFLSFAETVGGKRLARDGGIESVPDASFSAATEWVPARIDAVDALAHTYATWLVAPREERSLAPGGDVTLGEYVSRLAASGRRSLVLEALRLDPGHREAASALRSSNLR